MSDILFWILAIFALTGAVGMISFKNTIHSALSFIVTVLALAGIYALLSASFLFMVQIIIYAGAVIALLLFIIMFLNIKEENIPKEPNRFQYMAIAGIVILPIDYMILNLFFNISSFNDFKTVLSGFGKIKELGEELFRGWLLPFEAISVLLLVALIGSIVLARKEER